MGCRRKLWNEPAQNGHARTSSRHEWTPERRSALERDGSNCESGSRSSWRILSSRGDRDPRSMGRGPPINGPQSQNNMRPPPNGPGGVGGPPQSQLPPHLAGVDPEKAALISQVLQLSDEQIAGLPAEQRQSIMVLKEQMKHG